MLSLLKEILYQIKLRHVLQGRMSDMAIDMAVKSEIMGKVPGDMQ